MFRRIRRPLMRRPALRPEFEEVARANQLLQSGQPAQAAELLTRLAGQKQAQGRPRQAANLHAQAAHAWVEAGVEPRALNQARLAIEAFTHLGMLRRAGEFKARFAHHLRQKQLSGAADGFEQEVNLPDAPPTDPSASERRGQLPPECPQCGAPTRSDTVEWIDAHSAECDFCGATIPTED